MLSMLLILACTNAGAGGKTSTEVRLRIIAESLTTPDHSEPFSTEARIDETAETITVFIPELDQYSQSMDDTSIALRIYLPMGYEFELTDGGGAQHTSSDQDTPVSLPMVDLSDSGSFAVTQAGNSVTYTVSTFKGIPIFTEDELRGIQNIQDGMQENYFLMNDIALESNFEPLGSMSIPYTGIFDGRGKTISNLKIARSGEDYVGFFKYIGYHSTHSNYNENSNGEVRNLVLALAEDNENSPSIEGRNYVGAIAGRSYGKIDNVRVTGGIVKGTATNLGGLVGGQSAGTIENSYVTSDVSGVVLDSVMGVGDNVGGLVGIQKTGSIKNSHATGNVRGTNSVGGLVGNHQGDGNIENSHATGAVTGTTYLGGLVGDKQGTGNIENSHATGDVTGTNINVGGLVGNKQGTGDIKNSRATGAVMGSNTVGGLVGNHTDDGSIENSHATGDVTGTNNNVGGLVGNKQGTGDIKNSRATGAVTGVSSIGGLVGNKQGTGDIKNSSATGAVTGTAGTIGGLVGSLQGGEIKNSYATGDVEGPNSLGGLVGFLQGGEIKNSYATGAVMRGSAIGGLVGFQLTGTTITSSYFDAILTRPEGQPMPLSGIGNKPNSGVVTAFYTVDGVVRKDNNATADAVTSDDFSNWDPDIWQWQEGQWPTLYWQNQ